MFNPFHFKPFNSFFISIVFLKHISIIVLPIGLGISNWLELLVTNFQVFVIHALARYYLNQPGKLSLLFAIKVAYLAALTAAPISWVKVVMKCLLPVMLFDKGGQVYRHYKSKSTGQLSGATLLLQWLQFSGRICTSLLSGAAGDFILPMVLNVFFATLNGIQWILYKDNKQLKQE